MSTHDILIIVGDCVLASGTLPILAVTVLFGVRSNWRNSAAGRSQFYLAASCSMILVLVAYSRLSTSYGWPFPARD